MRWGGSSKWRESTSGRKGEAWPEYDLPEVAKGDGQREREEVVGSEVLGEFARRGCVESGRMMRNWGELSQS